MRQGPFVFNQWRADNADEELDLSGADLRGLDLDKMVFAGADLAGADLSRASARGAVFSGADLTGADLNLRGCDLSTLDLKRSSLDSAITNAAVASPGVGGRSPPLRSGTSQPTAATRQR
ncbi:pentapeptide repeat-containing protein [Actinomadura rudentiformis]|nr:pentapeptide repeat-containing protein [Actinomadura rudentiformis]